MIKDILLFMDVGHDNRWIDGLVVNGIAVKSHIASHFLQAYMHCSQHSKAA
jgi:hypothetical protein